VWSADGKQIGMVRYAAIAGDMGGQRRWLQPAQVTKIVGGDDNFLPDMGAGSEASSSLEDTTATGM